MEQIQSFSDLSEIMSGRERTYLLLYKAESEISICAFRNLTAAVDEIGTTGVFAADVTTVRDIHARYGVDSVPSVLFFEHGEYRNTIKGCHDNNFYKAMLSRTAYTESATREAKPAKRVTVYSTPTCSWCNTLKNWLKKEGISFSDVDVSKGQKAAEDMVKRSGQQGVPQTDINGKVVIGFNQPMLKELLEIR